MEENIWQGPHIVFKEPMMTFDDNIARYQIIQQGILDGNDYITLVL